MNAVEKRIYKLAKPYLVVRENDIHTRVATELALELLKHVGGDRRVVGPAIILHDVGWFNVPSELDKWRNNPENSALIKPHEIEGVKIAKRVLEEVGYDSSLVNEILHIIGSHDTGGAPQSVNEEIVRAADVLWRYTKNALGVMVRLFNSTPAEVVERLESNLNEWFFIPVSKKMAIHELEERKREVAAGLHDLDWIGEPAIDKIAGTQD